MTKEERIIALHTRMDALRRVRERRRTAAIGTACAVLTVCLFLMVFGGAGHSGGSAGMYSGAAILFQDAGGYVLTAILAFAAGVVVTVAIVKNRKRQEDRDAESKSTPHSEAENGIRSE